jgi:D-aminopeptidase
LGGYTVGVLVQSNFGGILSMGGAPVGKELGRYSFQRYVAERGGDAPDGASENGQEGWAPGDDGRGIPDADGGYIMMVVATDAPLDSRQLERLAGRALMGLARTGSSGGNGSGDYVLAFSSAPAVLRTPSQGPRTIQDLPNDDMNGLFQAAIEATEEAIYNSLLKATDVTGQDGRTAHALPLDEVLEVLRKYRVIGG